MSRRHRAAVFAAFVALSHAAGLVGTPFSSGGDWYDELDKPSFNPPSAVFAPVWITLYTMIGIAAGLVCLRESPLRKPALWLFAAQLVLNAAWSPVFFGAHAIRWALVVLAALWCAAVATAVAFFRVDRTAGALLVPYLAWLTFALVLNAAIVAMN